MNAKASFIRTMRIAAALSLPAWFAGCIWWAPPENFEATGHPVKRRDAREIKAGKTTRNEVIRLLGKPSRESVHTNAIAYSWERDFGGFAYVSVFGHTGVGTPTFGPSRAFVVAFDERNVVRKAQFISMVGKSTVDDRLIEYAGYQGPLPAAEIVPARPPVPDLILRVTEPISKPVSPGSPAVEVSPPAEE